MKPSRASERKRSTVRLGCHLLACAFGTLWSLVLVEVFEPHGSGGFALHVVSIWINLGLAVLVVIDAIAFRPKLSSVSALLCLGIGFATLWNS